MISITLVRDDAHTLSTRSYKPSDSIAEPFDFVGPVWAFESGTPTSVVGNPNIPWRTFRASC